MQQSSDIGPGRGAPLEDEGQGWKGPDIEQGGEGSDTRLDPSAELDDSVEESDPRSTVDPKDTDVN